MLQIEGVDMRLGVWWLEAAILGGVGALPLVNLRYTIREDMPCTVWCLYYGASLRVSY
jgi:hypothetical protein